jgi:hypothetical protein
VHANFNATAQTLIRGVLADHPDWERHLQNYEPADDAAAEPGSVCFLIPAPQNREHRLEIAQRGDTIEIAYDCGVRGLRAEQQFIVQDADRAGAVAAACGFVNGLCAGDVVVVCERLGRVARALRGDGVSELAWFRTKEHVVDNARRYGAIHRW